MLEQLGANSIDGNNVGFLVWAPHHDTLTLTLTEPTTQQIPMRKLEHGYFEAIVPDTGGTLRYMYEFADGTQRADPASRYQPLGVHGPSEFVRLPDIAGATPGWQKPEPNPELKEYIIYELHLGTFTTEGTFEAAIKKLPYLKELGITAIELMPVAQFPGARNWGYDGVYPFAPHNTYGGPEGLRALVSACHQSGIAVVLDVVYNHLGPEGNYLGEFGPYFTNRYHGPWGDAINYDGPESKHVRRYFIENAVYWVTRYGIDALRIDAVHGIFDNSSVHILEEMTQAVKQEVRQAGRGRNVYIIAESDLNDVRLITPVAEGGWGLDAQWNDDFHHSLHTRLTGERNGYYMDFGDTSHLLKAIKDGFVYTGQHSKFRGRDHGTSSAGRPPWQFVVFMQNHDQVGNRPLGDRLAVGQPVEKLMLAAAMVLLSPGIPLIFMGEEYAECAPFYYFADHSDKNLIQQIRQGREREFEAIASGTPGKGTSPAPEELNTYMKCKLKDAPDNELLKLYRNLIQLRKKYIIPLEGVEVKEYPKQEAISVSRASGTRRTMLVASFNAMATDVPLRFKGEGWKLAFESAGRKGPGVSANIGQMAHLIPLAPYGFALYVAGWDT